MNIAFNEANKANEFGGLTAAKLDELKRLVNKFDGASRSPRRGNVVFPFGKDGKKQRV